MPFCTANSVPSCSYIDIGCTSVANRGGELCVAPTSRCRRLRHKRSRSFNRCDPRLKGGIHLPGGKHLFSACAPCLRAESPFRVSLQIPNPCIYLCMRNKHLVFRPILHSQTSATLQIHPKNTRRIVSSCPRHILTRDSRRRCRATSFPPRKESFQKVLANP